MPDQSAQNNDDKRTSVTGDGNVIGNNNIVTVIKETNISSPQLTSLHQLRSPPSDFIGRDDDIRKAMAEFEKGIAIVGLFGMGGVGKTDLALILADKLRNTFPDAQFLIDMRGTTKPALAPSEAMAQVIYAYDPLARLPESQSAIQGLYNSVLQGKRALILLDNAASREQVEPLIPPAGCFMLITSRFKFALRGMKSLDLDVLSPEDARSLLLANADRIGDNAGKLAKLCGYLPLALRNAAYVLAECINLEVTEYINRLNDAKKRLDLVGASFDLSYDLLTPDLRKKWAMLSIFPADFDQEGAAAIWKIDSHLVIDALSDLLKWNLVNFNPSAEPNFLVRYRLHDLAKDFAGLKLNDSARRAAEMRHAEYYMDVILAANGLYEKGGESALAGLKLLDRDWMNIQSGQSWAAEKSQGGNKQFALILSNEYPNAGFHLLGLRLHPRERIRWLETALAASRKLKDRKKEGYHLGNLGLAYAALGNARKAVEYHECALTNAREIGDRRNEGSTLGNLGLAYAALGNARKAIEYHECALIIFCEIGDKKSGGAELGNLGLAYSALSEPRKAIVYYDRALAIARETGDRHNEGNWLGNLGNANVDLGEMQEAIRYYEQALAIDREMKDRKGEGTDLGNLGNAFYLLGEPRMAIVYYDRALVIAREIGDRRNEGSWLGNLGNIYADLCEPRMAIVYYDRALVIAREIGDRHNEANWLGNLGNAHADLGETIKAIEYHEQELVIAREIGDRRGEGNALGNVGNSYAILGEMRKAIEYYERQRAIAREIGDKRGEGNALWNTSLALVAIGERKEAVDSAKAALMIYEQIEDPTARRIKRKLDDWRS